MPNSKNKNPTYMSGHCKPKPRYCLIFPLVDIMDILWEISRPPDHQTTICCESIPNREPTPFSTLTWQVISLIRQDAFIPMLPSTDISCFLPYRKTSFEQMWYLLSGDNKFFLPFFSKSSGEETLLKKKKKDLVQR